MKRNSKAKLFGFVAIKSGEHHFLVALEALHLHMELSYSLIHHSSFRVIDAAMLAHLVRSPPTSLHKQVGGYMRPDNLQLACVLPYKHDGHHGRHGHHGCHGHHGHHG